MLSSVLFVNREGVSEVIEEKVDLDYWNIRQWRRLHFLFCERQKQDYVKLVIRPYLTDPF